MPSDQPRQTLADYVTLVLSPALIMGLVGSLVFFLLEVLYQGQYQERLQWILFFFVFGAVLVARLAILANTSVPPEVYGSVLALLVWLGMQQFVEYPGEMKIWSWGINLVLVGVVWWSARQLTWSCTHVDEQADMTGEGLLQASGVEQTETRPEPGQRDENKKQRPLGVWVVYFSLASLPIFGLGQAFIPVEEGGRRAYVFWLTSVYVGSGLGLLLTTCFLSLRRYLRQRGLQMPAAMTGVWLSVGGALVAGLLVAGALLPRPSAEYSVLTLLAGKSPKQRASRLAVPRGGPAQQTGRSGSPGRSRQGDPMQDSRAAGKAGSAGEQQDRSQEGNGPGQQQDRQQGGKQQGDQSGQDGKEEQDRQQENPPGQQPRSGRSSEESRSAEAGKKASQADPVEEQESSRRESLKKLSRLAGTLSSLARVLKWIVFGLLVVVALGYVGRIVLHNLAPFSEWAQRLLDALHRFWASLFGGQRPAGETGTGDERQAEERRPRFADFGNPFLSDDNAMSARQLVRYVFAAAQAWAAERGLERQPGETPLELARRVGGEVPALEAELHRLAVLYAQAAYGPGSLPAGSAAVLRQVWQRLEEVAEQPLSA